MVIFTKSQEYIKGFKCKAFSYLYLLDSEVAEAGRGKVMESRYPSPQKLLPALSAQYKYTQLEKELRNLCEQKCLKSTSAV